MSNYDRLDPYGKMGPHDLGWYDERDRLEWYEGTEDEREIEGDRRQESPDWGDH